MPAIARFAWGVLGWNVAVVLWGAYVRATGSGAGCGAHWPLCNGQVIPRAPTAEMLVEFSHRATSGLALLAVIALAAWAFRRLPAKHPGRRGAGWSLFFMFTEAAVGAGLVLFQLVADNASLARALFMAVHLLNTFVLLACLALTAYWMSGGAAVGLRRHGALAGWLAGGAVGLLLTGVSGAVAALGDTLYPSASLADALSADISATSHVLIRLRLFHPAIAIAVGVLLIAGGLSARRVAATRTIARLATWLAALAAAQLGVGFLNVLLLAPVWMQLLHLLVADGVWIVYVLLAASALAEPRAAPEPRPAPGQALRTV